MRMYIQPRSGETLLNLLFGLIQLIVSTLPKVRRLTRQTILTLIIYVDPN